MRPKELIIEAFGPFAKKEIIDFSKLNRGLFLITGDTGSGKTTIFDAITFALYGEASGNNRKAVMLRSDFAQETAITRVTYTFFYENNIYKVSRTPQYERAKQRGTGTVTCSAEAVLYDVTGEECVIKTGALAVTEKIIDIMGINREQFVNVSMIAQGEFLKLLLAKSTERAGIFRNIFKTRIYENVQNTLKYKARELYGKMLMKKQALIRYAKGVSLENIEDYSKLLQDGNVYILPEFMDDMEKEIKREEERAGYLKEEKKRYKKIYDGAIEKLAKEKEKQKAYKEVETELKKAGRNIADLEEKLKKAETEYLMWEERQKDIDDINEKAVLIKDSLASYEEFDKLIEAEEKKKRDLLIAKSETEETEKSISRKEKEKSLIEKNIAELTEKYESLETEKNKAAGAYEKMSDAFLRSQAGIMAANLSEGKPCPVCGSTTHPNKQALTNIVCTEEELKKAKQEKGRLKKELEKISADTGKLQKELKLKDEDILKDRAVREKQILREQEILLTQKQLMENIDSKRKKLSYENYGEACKAYERCIKEIEGIKRKEKQTRETVEKYRGAVNGCRGIIDKDTEWLKKKKKTLADTSVTEKECSESQLKLREIEKEEKQLEITITCNRKARADIMKEKEEYDLAEKEWEIYDNLSRTANGAGYTKGKFDFESYVQAKYFEQIIELANVRLSKMTQGRFLLLRRKEAITKASHVGLEIDVLDNNTGKVRRGETLSGGEAFMAALSMALGMSDVISCSSGGIRLDAMFIDEGFGSLDSNALEKALSILTELSNTGSRTIGIISHVEALKERIDNKIVVEKGIKGSHIAAR